ncbi:carboxypeptidase-like regulatory domain-containing protein [Urechidicola croceus]|uniref:carboxypeptidase-like regulatory domain-containing protein n=1 Tax=Urechidicola croceus TaxID=1850246 RepID=UPI001E513D43|nr:carboxypeptidase-like regulatory domain-containing protein [Urechidicola croceus]
MSIISYSQSITLKGVVKDSITTPLSYANIIAIPKDTAKTMTFAITDDVGRYNLSLHQERYTITVSYLGFETYNFELDAQQDIEKNIVLKPKENQLEEVVIEIPVIVKQDTMIYNADSFTTGEERKLKNVLKKLPGVDVDKDGEVTVNGKKVTTMLVEGEKFFGGGSKLAVENIPADAIDKVVVLDNYNEIPFLKNLSDSDEMAMNIELKEDKKKFVFGDIEAGKGNKDYYRTHSNLFYYSPEINANFIGNVNNVAETTFTFKDFMNFQGGINAVFRGDGLSLNSSRSDFSQFMESQDLVSRSSKFGALNITKTVNNKLNVNGYAIFSDDNSNTFEETQNQYVAFLEDKESTTNSKNILGIGKINFDYTPNLKEQWYFRTQFKKSDNFKNNNISSIVNFNNNLINTRKDAIATLINQNIEWHKKVSNKHTFSFVADYVYNKNNPNTFWETNNSILQGLIPIIDEPIYELSQLKETQRNNFETILKHYWVLNNNNHVYTTLGNRFSNDQFSTYDSQLLNNGSTNNFNTSGFGNDLDFKLNDNFLGLHYKFRTGIFTFKQGGYFHNYNWKANQTNTTKKQKTIFLPDFLSEIEFKKSEKLKATYQLKSTFSNASKYANQFYLQSYNSVYRGNELLENELFHSARIRYSKFSMYKGLMLFASVNFTKKIKGIQNNVEFDGVNQFLTPILIDNPETRWNYNGNIRKKIKNINYKFSVNYMSSNYIQFIDNIRNKNKNNTSSFEMSAKTLYDDFPTIEIGYKRSLGKYVSGNTNSKFTTNEPFINIDYDFLKGFIFSFDYRKYNYENKEFNQENKYELGNATLSYRKENSAWSFKLDAKNIFDVKFKNQNSFSSYIISDTKTYIMPRIIMLSLGYNL